MKPPMNQTDQIRAEFEADYPPQGLVFNGREYECSETHVITLLQLAKYNALWQGYQSGRAAVKGETVAWLDLSKLEKGSMAYASSFKVNDKQSPLFTSPQPAPDQWDEVTEAIDNIRLCFVDLVADKVALAAMVPLGRLVALEKAILALRKGA